MVCSHYSLEGLSIVKLQGGDLQNLSREQRDLYELKKEQATRKLYHLVEYCICELRRLLYAPISRAPTDKSTWSSKCRRFVDSFRSCLTSKHRRPVVQAGGSFGGNTDTQFDSEHSVGGCLALFAR